MRSPNFNIITVRSPAGALTTSTENYRTLIQRLKFLNLPILRGMINMFEMLLIGTRALNFSSRVAFGEEVSESKPVARHKQIWNHLSILLSTILGLTLAIGLFKFLPLWITTWLSQSFPFLEKNYLFFNLVDGLLKTSIFIAYISLLALLPDVKRLFMYHGAEHKSIMTYEQGLDLTIANARGQTRFHPRCGTSFILIVFLISIVVFTFIPRQPDFLVNFFTRMSALPLIAGLSYELLKYSAKRPASKILAILSRPGLLMQRITTSEPDDDMLEVALHALRLALQSEQASNPSSHVI